MYFNRKNAEQKNWRMIKKGKHFLFGCSLVFAIGAALVAPSVKADTVEANPEAGSTTEGIKPVVAEEDVTYAAPAVEVAPSAVAPAPVVTEEKAEKPVATTENAKEEAVVTTTVSVDKSQLEAVLAQSKAKSLEGQEASVKAEVAAAIAEAEAIVANGSASQDQVNQSVERLTQSLASVKEVTEVASETRTEETTESSATPKVRSRRATTEGTARSIDEKRLDRVTVTKDNFDSYFKEGGSASYDETSGTIKLTDDVSGQVGSAYLRFKIDPREDFTFTGKVDIGDKYEGHTVGGRPGGDGVGFVFHTGNVDTIGQSGASIGMGTIKNAFGFKLDSWHNTSNPNANQNASADPRYGGNAWRSNAFGSFYSSNNAGRVTTSSSAAKALNPAPSGQWVDFKIEYKGQTKEFIVTYGSEKWSTNLKTANASIMEPTAKTALNNSNATYALSFLGSTGSGTNLQRVQIEKFVFTAPQIVQVAFYDEAGHELAASSAIPGNRDEVIHLNSVEAVQKAITKLKTKGYTLKEVNSDRAETYNAATNTVRLRKGGQLLKYVFAVPTPEVTKTLPSDGGMLPNGGIKSTDNTLSGTGTPGATINIKVAGNTVVDNVTVESNGKWTATLPTGLNSNVTTQDQLVPKNSLVVTQKIGVSESEAATVDVALGESSVVPSTESKDQQSIVAETTTVTLKVPHDAGIAYFDYPNANNGRSEVAIKRDSIPGTWTSKDESKAVVKSYSSDGFFDTVVLEMKDKIQAGKAKVISNIKENKYSSPVGWKEINVEAKPDTTPPAAPTVNAVKAGATSITGTAEANSKVEATLPNGSKVTATTGADGSFTIPVSGLNEGDTISVTATDAADNKSTPSVVTVKENVRPVVTIPYDDKANQIIYVYSGEENNIELKITDNSGKIAKAYLVFAQDNRTGLGTEDTGYLNGKTKNALYLKANRFGSETTATVANPAIIKLTANIPNGSYTDGTGMTRYIYAEDLAGNTNYDNAGAAWDTGAPGRIRFVWKPQSFKYNAVAPSTPLTSNTVPEASAIEKAVKDANPTFSDKIGSVTLDGTNVKVTYKDGSTDLLPANSVFTIEPTAPTVTPVKNTSALTTPEKQAVEAAVRTKNPDATTVVVGNDGSTTLTYSNGSTAKLTPSQTVKAADANGVQAPGAKTPVQNTSALTQPEKDAVKKAVAEANPTATKVEVGNDGSATVTFPDGSTATLTGDKTVKEADSKGVQEPAAKTPVQNTSALTQPEKDAVKKAVEDANPTATKVEVGNDGLATVTFPDGTTATLTGDKTVKEAASKGVQEPAAKTPVQNTSALTQPEKDAVKKAVEDANPTATKVEVGNDGLATVTFPDGTTATLTGDKTVKEAASKGVQEPAAKTPVQNTSALTQPEKDAVKKAVAEANPTATKVEVGNDGSATVTFPDGSTATLTGDKTVKEADSKGVQEPAAKTPVQNTSALTQPEKDAVKKAVAEANPTATKVEVGNDGSATVTFPDGSTATLTGDKTVKEAASKGVQEPAAKTPVQNTSALTQPEKDAVKKAVADANPTATKVEVGNDGSATVTFPDGSTATLTGDKTVKEADSKGVKAPTTKTPAQNTSSLTQPEKDAVKKAVEGANPSATKVEVGNDGSATVTFPDGTTATLTGDKTVKEADSKGVKAPTTKTPAQNTSSLTQPEKDAVKKAVEGANPSATKVEVGNDGSATVTFPDGSTATLTPAQTVVKAEEKAKDADGLKAPETKTPVKDTANLTDAEKAEVKKAVEAANPGSVAEVGQDGTTKVTFPDKSEGTLTPAQTVVKAKDAASIKEPATKTPVKDTANLTDDEKAEVKKAVEAANPGSVAEVGQDGTTKVTFPDKSEGTLTPAQTVVKAKDAAGIKEPATKTPVKDTAKLTDDEKAEVKKAVEAANPGSVAEVGQDGTTKVTFPDKSEGTLTPAQTVVKAEEKAKDADGLKAPETKTPVKDTANLTDDEKAEVKKAVEAANPRSVAEVGQDGTTKVTFPDKSEGTLTGDQTVKAADANGAKAPATKTPVKDTSTLTDEEKTQVAEEILKANPTLEDVDVANDGTATVTFPDGSKATLTPAQTVVKAEEKAKEADGLKAPATKTPVKDTANLTDAEKAEVKKAVEAANPGSVAEVGQDGTTKVTFPDKSEGTLTPAQTVVKAEEKAKDADGLKAPETKTPVKDTANLTDAEKAEVKKAVEAANPGSVAEVGQDGTTKVTFPDKSEGTLTPAQTVVKAKDAAGIKEPATKTPVKDTAKLTDDEKAEVKKAVEAANPGSVAEVGQDGTTKVTFPDKSEGTLTPAQTVVKAEEKAKDADGLKAPETKTPVKDTANLTDDEKAEVKKAVEAANPRSVAEVGQDGTTKVTFPDKSEGTLTGDQTVKAADANGAKAPATKTPVKDTSTLTDEEKTQVAEEILKANPTLEDVDVANDGTATVTFPDGSKATLTPAQTVVKAEEKAKEADGLKAPETKTPVKDTANLTDAEKAEVKKAVEAANPGSVAEVGQDGTTKVTFPDKSEGTLTPEQTVVKAEEKAKDADGLKAPETKTPVKDTANLTDAEKAEVKKAVEAANPGSVAEVGQDGTTTVTFPDGSTATLTPAQTVVKAEDKEAPTAPVVNPVKAGDTAVTGTAEAGSTVEVTLPNGTKATATAGEDGTFSVPVSGLNEGDKVSVTATDAAGNKSGATEAIVAKADDKTAPDAPKVNEVKAGDTAVTGTAEAGSTVEVTLPNGTKATATAGEDGTFSVPVSGLNEGDKVSVTATDAAGNKSGATEATVAKADDKTAPDAPKVNEVKAGATAVTGKAEAGSTVEVTLPNGTKATATAGEDGTFSVPVSGLNEGDKVSVTATDAAGNKSGATEATVAKADDKEAPAAPVVNDVKEGDKAVTGTAEVGSIIEIILPNSETVTVRADEAGHFSLPVVGLKAGDKVTAVAKDASGNTSTPTEKTVGKRDVKDADGIQAPSTKTPVKDTANLTDAEKAKVKEAVEASNPGSKAEVGQDGTTTVTFPDGSTATLTGDQTVKTADSNGVQAPSTKTPVKDTANLTDAEKAKVKEAVEAANPGSKAEVGQDGTTTVTFPDGSTATLTGDQTVKTADANGVQAPSTKTPVKDTANLTDAEKAKVKEAVEAANPGSKAEVGQDGTTTVTFPDGSTATLTGDQTVKTADSNGVQAPTTKTPVKDTANLTDAEKAKVKEAVEAANPGSKAEVGQDGTTTVTFPDGSTATLTGDQTVKTADSNGVQAPTTKTPVKDTANLTDAEKAKVKEAVEAANPGSKAEVGQDGTTTVTFPDGSTATLTGDQTVKTADSNGVQAPSTKTPVKDTANLTDAEKAKVKEAVEAANPGSKAEVGQDGTTTVTFPDGSTATLTGDKTVTQADITAPTAPVVNPVKAGDTAVTGTAEAGSTVEVTLPDGTKVSAKADKDGKFSIPVNGLNAGDTVSVTATDESGNTSATTTVTVSNVNVGGKEADNAKVPALTPVVDPNNLTDAEKAKVAEEVKKANPTATDVKVNNDGSVVVTFADGSVATIAANKVVKEATKESSAQAPAKKAGAKELPNTGTKQSNASLGLALLAAVTGGLLISKKRKEEE